MTKRAFTFFILIMFILSSISLTAAIDIEVKKEQINSVLVKELKSKPATLDIKVTNNGPTDYFQFYNLLGFSMAPVGTVRIGSAETKNVKLILYPPENFDFEGFYILQYFIRSQDTSEITEGINIKIINLGDAFKVGAENIDLESSAVNVFIENKENFDFGEMDVKFTSSFFNIEETFTLGSKEREEFVVDLKREDFNKLMAGFYTLNAEITVEDAISGTQKTNVEGTINFVEKNLLTTEDRSYGVFITTKTIKKQNEGNVLENPEILIKKNIISRLFTSFTPEPLSVDRDGFIVSYKWKSEVRPGEALEVNVKTNWLIPLIIIILIVIVVALVRKMTETDLLLRKKVSFVRTRGGEFALRVALSVIAKKHLERINIIERIPTMAKVHERFSYEAPSRIDQKNRRIEWDFQSLESGEKRFISYIIHSKVSVFGKFALPSAKAIYEKDGKIHEVTSNKAFFIAEQTSTPGGQDEEF
jgi:hypothetical protein